jgi:ABC-2 type transport system ATP-binding protein
MLALHREGRGPDALTAYRLARCRLADEVGLDPEPRLQQLATAILRADPALDLPGPAHPGPRRRLDPDDGDAPAGEPAEGWPGGEPAMSDVTLEADRLTKTFGRRTAVADLSFTARQGEVLGLLGANGAGKTTTIRLLTTMLRPTRGDFAVAGIPSSRQAEIRGRVGVLPEGAGYPGHQTGLDYLSYHARLFGMRRAEATRTAARLLDELGLGDRARSRIATYSRGMRQRLGIARALLNAPAVILLDEPTLGLDPAGRHQVLGLLRDVARCTGATVLLSTNTLPEIREVCTDLLVLDEGRVALAGPAADVAPALAGRQIGRVRVPPELTDRAVEAVRDVPGVTVDVAADRSGVLRLSVAPAAGSGPGELPLNAVLQAVLSAGVPVLSYETEDSRPADAVPAGPGRSDRRP